MNKNLFKTLRKECENKVKEILIKNKCAVELEMTKNILLSSDNIVQPQTIFFLNDKIGVIDEYDEIYNIGESDAIFSILDLLETYDNDMEENAKIIIAIG